MAKACFAVLFCNRGFFPASLHAEARRQMRAVLEGSGHTCLMMDEKATPHGAVETPAHGRLFAEWLKSQRGTVDGIIACLPNFGDETGAVEAVREAGLPILIQAYPDDMDKMAPALRRDAFCGKLSVMDVLRQYHIPFTALTPHVAHPESAAFAKHLDYFSALCLAARAARHMTVGSIGARTTAFKTVRIDELALQKHGITMETFDLSDIFARMDALAAHDERLAKKQAALLAVASWDGVPEHARQTLSRLGVVLDTLVDDCGLDAIALRCWIEIQQRCKVSPCVVLGEMNDRLVAAACEVDVGNAVMMRVLRAASGRPATCLDWNNNYGDDEDKCILFHCGPVPASLMTGCGKITDHAILANAIGQGCGWGCNTGRIAPTPFTFGSMLTRDGNLCAYVGEGRFTADTIPADFFGCAGVAEIRGLQSFLQTIGYEGHRHHVSITPGVIAPAVHEALVKYCGWQVLCWDGVAAR